MSKRHGMSKSPTWNTWHSMKLRCHNPNAPDYHRYGGKGIYVCDRWRKSFVAFLEDMGVRPDGKTLDRINNKKGYNKENCRWATHTEQHYNSSQARLITYKGQTKCMKEWCRILKLEHRYGRIRQRIRKGWDFHSAITIPSLQKGRMS